MSVCGQNGQAEEDSGSEEITAAASAVRDLYKQKPVSKAVRVLTVLAYLLSVSLAAILLSVYYVCVWKSPELPRLNDTDPAASRLSARPPAGGGGVGGGGDYASAARSHNANGGGDSAVKGAVTPTPVPITNRFEYATSTTGPEFDFTADTLTPRSEPSDNVTSYPSAEDFNGTIASVT